MGFLAIDVGNTRLKWALFEAPHPGAQLLTSGACLLEEIDALGSTQWSSVWPHPTSMLGCLVAGETVRRRVEEQLVRCWSVRPRWIMSMARQCGVSNGYDHPMRLGPDRWAALIGARWRLPDHAVLVTIVGTAVTVDALNSDGTFVGGLILPGYGLMLQALEMGTAGLKVPSGEFGEFPTNTSDALMSGGSNAIAGAIERMYRNLMRRANEAPTVLVSGGAADKILPIIELPHLLVPTVIFDGLLCMADERQPTQPTLLPDSGVRL